MLRILHDRRLFLVKKIRADYEGVVLMPVVTGPVTLIRDCSTAAVQEEPQGKLRVMVVEDGRNAADILAMFFEMEGHEVVVAYDGAEAVEKAAVFHPNLVLMDIGMPRMDGLEAARRIRCQRGGSAAVIIALSGLDQDDDKRQCTEAGIDFHLSKPVCPKELRTVIGRFRERLA